MSSSIISVSVDKIKPYINNPRKNDNAVKAVMESIKQFGFLQPIVVDKKNIIIVGHTRLKAAKKLGLKQVPVIVADKLTKEQIMAYRIADNSTGDLAVWDMDLLNQELVKLDELKINMLDFGFKLLSKDTFENKRKQAEQQRKYIVVIEYENEDEQKTTYNYLIKNGYKPKCLMI